MHSPIRVILVDDCPIIRDTVEYAFQLTDTMSLVGYAKIWTEAIPLFKQHQPDFGIIDVLMPEMDGFELARLLHASHPALRLLFFSGLYSTAYLERARRLGACGWVVKGQASELVSAIEAVSKGLAFIAPEATRSSITAPPGDLLPSLEGAKELLTIRELAVLRLWTEGLEVKEIADRLGIAARTVETHRFHIIQKTGTRSLAHLTKLAIDCHLIAF
jgi:DNA-binding NarL/FixJ family response regulator